MIPRGAVNMRHSICRSINQSTSTADDPWFSCSIAVTPINPTYVVFVLAAAAPMSDHSCFFLQKNTHPLPSPLTLLRGPIHDTVSLVRVCSVLQAIPGMREQSASGIMLTGSVEVTTTQLFFHIPAGRIRSSTSRRLSRNTVVSKAEQAA